MNTTLDSNPRILGASPQVVYDFLSDFTHYPVLFGQSSASLAISSDRVELPVPALGRVALVMHEKLPHTTLIAKAENDKPFPFHLIIQLTPDGLGTRLQVQAEAQLNLMMKPMVKGPMIQALEHLAQAIQQQFPVR